jgi:protein SCO1
MRRIRQTWMTIGFLAASTTVVAADAASNARDGAETYFAGVTLVDQDGRTVDLYRDFVEDRVVVMHSFFASCPGSCPVTMTTLKALQTRLGPRLGRDVHVVSITVDPDRDTPRALKRYAERIDAGSGWRFLTGSHAQVDVALKRIGQAVDDADAHTDIIVAGNMRTGLWKKIHGLAESADVVDLIMDVADDTGER